MYMNIRRDVKTPEVIGHASLHVEVAEAERSSTTSLL